jgi:hypothetical protein
MVPAKTLDQKLFIVHLPDKHPIGSLMRFIRDCSGDRAAVHVPLWLYTPAGLHLGPG